MPADRPPLRHPNAQTLKRQAHCHGFPHPPIVRPFARAAPSHSRKQTHPAGQVDAQIPRHPGRACKQAPHTHSTAAVAAAFPFVAEPLRDLANYSTYMLGKWHLGHANESRLPVHRGFQHSLGYLTGQEDYYCRSVGPSCPNITTAPAPAPPPGPGPGLGAAPARCPAPSYGKNALVYDRWADDEYGNFDIV